MEIILTRGLSGSGKSTWAKEYVAKNPDFVRVCRDDLRFMLGFGWKFNKEHERYVKDLRDKIISDWIGIGKNVIVDELNLSGKNEIYFKQKYPTANIWIKDFTDVHPNICIERDAKREHSVGKKVILQQWRQFIEPAYVPAMKKRDLPTAVLVDADGTLSLFHNKNPYERDFENDQVNDRLRYILHQMFWDDMAVFIVSGRSSKYREQTIEFLRKNDVEYNELYMRAENDKRPDVEVKKDIYEKHIKDKYSVFCVFDDRPAVKKFWVSQGLYVFDCNQHSVEF